jgi:phosphonate transport system ATP-binding protein
LASFTRSREGREEIHDFARNNFAFFAASRETVLIAARSGEGHIHMATTEVNLMVRFEAVSKHFPDCTQALKSVSLEVPKGEFCVVLGPSGAGKSTLLRLLNGLVAPSEGEFYFAGERVTRRNLRSVQKRVAMIHQSFNLVQRLPVISNVLSGMLPAISTPRALLGVFPAELQRKACRLIDRVGLGEEHVYRRAGDLSGGQQQRVGIARAFIGDPLVVLADEPVASLDPRISRSILSLLKEASREQDATVLCSLHQVDLTREFADRVIGMHAGRVVFDGGVEELTDEVLSVIYDGTRTKTEVRPDIPYAACALPFAAYQRAS